MTLRNFDTELDRDEATSIVGTTTSTMMQVRETVEVLPNLSTSRTHLIKSDEEWGWEEMRDYVVHEIEVRFGAFPRDSIKEASMFKAFITRHGKRSAAIARHAFEVCDGKWAGAPVSVNRFARNSDPYFAEVIAARLVDEPVSGWS